MFWEAAISTELREQARSGHLRPEQKLAICAGSVPLSPEDQVEMLAILAVDADPSVSERAENILLTQSVQHFLAAANRPDADVRLFAYCAENLAEKAGRRRRAGEERGLPDGDRHARRVAAYH